MKIITILGHDLNVSFNMAAEIEYEEQSGKPFDLQEMNTQKATMQLCYAVLKVSNNNVPFTIDEMNRKATFSETNELKSAIIEAVNEWLGIPAVMAEKEQAQTSDEAEKNV
jgi:hypothetical protein